MQKRKLEDLQSWAYVFSLTFNGKNIEVQPPAQAASALEDQNQPIQAAPALMLRSMVTSSNLFKKLLQEVIDLSNGLLEELEEEDNTAITSIRDCNTNNKI